ncbi:hypothetical protein I7I50_09583 [Histoplasma capsulatum G186AR]|uniref:Uncharacterized protein n=1 Tax=Ajellomyces capsulatus TaxID=5037 RepID=A0A8H7YSL3_AJECA|nr:hypothetical protein I7I52_07104 [Histoplasma capsulatum]QSS74424.1 hypothetical protein I7I50_09583 [Histoplasma capsulatum G186AR]
MDISLNNEIVGETVGEVIDVNVSSGGSIYKDDVMVDVLTLSSVVAFSTLICASTSSAISAPLTVYTFSAALNSTSLAYVNPLFFFHTGFSLASTLLKMLCIFCSSFLYLSHSPSAPTASNKMHFHTQVLYNTIHFTSYLSVASLA